MKDLKAVCNIDTVVDCIDSLVSGGYVSAFEVAVWTVMATVGLSIIIL